MTLILDAHHETVDCDVSTFYNISRLSHTLKQKYALNAFH